MALMGIMPGEWEMARGVRPDQSMGGLGGLGQQQPQRQTSALGGLTAAALKLAEMDVQGKEQRKMERIFAANPQFAQALYGAKNDMKNADLNRELALAQLQKIKDPSSDVKQVGGALLKINKDGTIQELYRGASDTGGSTGVLIDRLMQENPDLSFADALAQVQTGYRRGVNIQGGVATPIEGLGVSLGDLGREENFGKETGTLQAKTIYEPELNTARTMAETATEAKISLPKFEEESEKMIANIDNLLNSEGFEAVVGLKSPFKGAIPMTADETGDPAVVSGSPAADALARLQEIKGGQFLQAFETLKGGGQITQIEGTKATQAISRMSTAQSEKEFKKAAEEFKGVIRGAVNRMKRKAAGQSAISPQENVNMDMMALDEEALNAPYNPSSMMPPMGSMIPSGQGADYLKNKYGLE